MTSSKCLKVLFIFLLLHFVVSALKSSGLNADSTTETLLNHVFENYDKRIRPFAEDNVAVKIDMTIVLGILIEIRENEQVAAYVISHLQKWRDPKLRWRPREYNNTRELVVPHTMIWLPKLFVYNSMMTQDMLSNEKWDVRLTYDGQVKINIPQYVTCICRLSIEYFPFDHQYCAVALASPLLTVEEMDVFAHPPPKDSYFAGNAEWELINVTSRHLSFLEEGEYRAEVHYIFQLRRRAIFYIAVLVIPIYLISLLSILGIFTPSTETGQRNEKVSLGLGSLLSMTVLFALSRATWVILGILASAMPKSNSIPLLGYYILSVIILCAVSVAFSLLFLTLSRRLVEKGRIPSKFTYKLVFLDAKKFVGATKSRTPRRSTIFRPSLTKTLLNGVNKHSPVPPLVDLDETKFQFEDLAKIHKIVRYLAQEHYQLKKKSDRDHTKLLIQREWARIFSRLDYFLMAVFETLNLASLLFFLQYAWANPQPMREPLV